MRSGFSSVQGASLYHYSVMYMGQATLLAKSSTSTGVCMRTATLPHCPASDYKINHDESGDPYIVSKSLGLSQWVA